MIGKRKPKGIYAIANHFGEQIAISHSLMAEFAIEVARAVVAGEVDLDDAGAVYIAFYNAAYKRSEGQDFLSKKVQVSKLRTIMRLSTEFGEEGVALLEKVVAVHKQCRINGLPFKSLYPAMVDVARMRLSARWPVGDAGIDKLIERVIVPARTHAR